MRILTVGNMYPPHHRGGYELVWESAVDHLRERGHEVRVLTTDVHTSSAEPDGPDIHRALRWHLRQGEFEHLGPLARTRLARHNHATLNLHLEAFSPDVVAWWSMGGLTLTMLEAVRRRGLPAVAFVHDDWLAYGPRVDPWTRWFAGSRRSRLASLAERLTRIPATFDPAAASRFVFVSEFMRRRTEGLGYGSLASVVAPSGIHPGYLDPAPVRDWQWRLLCVGRLDPRKGVATGIEALRDLPPEARLDVVGGGDERERERLAALARTTATGERVAFLGQGDRAGLFAAYGAADAVVFPVSWDEPWGLVPLEAMARGRPVVATGRGGSGEYLRDGENCLLFEAEDPADLAAALRRLAADPALRARLREGGLRTAERHTAPVFNAAVERAMLEAADTAGARLGIPAR